MDLKIFEILNMTDKFDVIKGVDSENPMTKAQLLQYCIEILNVPKERVLLIGDSIYDARGAQEAGIDFLGVTYGFGFKYREDIGNLPNVGMCGSVQSILSFLNIK